MKAKNPNTGNFENIYIKALDSMPVGTEVDFDGNSSDIPVGWEEVLNKVVLYEDENGTLGDITLSETAENFEYMDFIVYEQYTSLSTVFRAYKPNGNYVILSQIRTDTVGTCRILVRTISVNGTNITNFGTRYSTTEILAGQVNNTNTNNLKILKIIGYKEV